MSSITRRVLDCGAVLVHEEIPAAGTVATGFLVPVGTAGDGPDDGHAVLLSELVLRGAGGLDSRELSDALDRLGVQRACRAGNYFTTLTGTCLADRLGDALPLLASILVRPALPAEGLEAVRSLCLQSLEGLEDDPQHLVMLRLAERHLPAPFNRHGYGEEAVLKSAGLDELRAAWTRRCAPVGSIIASAGGVSADEMARQLDAALAGWTGEAPAWPDPVPSPRGHETIREDHAQVHISMGWDAPTESDPDSMRERLAMRVLSGSTSGRLFSEVRQKRSLCYSVGASYRAGRDRGWVSLYAGTTPERAQETLDVCAMEIERLGRGFERDEFDRAVIGLKSRLVMQGESTPARAAALGSDEFRLGRPRSLEEVLAAVEAITPDELGAYVAARTPGPFTVLTLGPAELEAPDPARVAAATAPAD